VGLVLVDSPEPIDLVVMEDLVVADKAHLVVLAILQQLFLHKETMVGVIQIHAAVAVRVLQEVH
jgi:hypothetical protein